MNAGVASWCYDVAPLRGIINNSIFLIIIILFASRCSYMYSYTIEKFVFILILNCYLNVQFVWQTVEFFF